jgi:hypothetical protein
MKRLTPRQVQCCVDRLLLIPRKFGIGLRAGLEQEFLPGLRRRRGGSTGTIVLSIPIRELLRPLLLSEGASRHRPSLQIRLCRGLAHELGHFLVAPKGRRYKKDYGIASERRRSEASHRFWEIDECKAKIVEHYLLARCGFGRAEGVRKRPLRSHGVDDSYRWSVERWWRTEGQKSVEEQLS